MLEKLEVAVVLIACPTFENGFSARSEPFFLSFFPLSFSIKVTGILNIFCFSVVVMKIRKKGHEKTKTKKNRTLYWPVIEKFSCHSLGGKKKQKMS